MDEMEEEQEEKSTQYYELLKMVNDKVPGVEQLKEITRQEVIEFHDKEDPSIRPFCRVAVCLDCPGVVSYFYVAINFKNEWCFYKSNEW